MLMVVKLVVVRPMTPKINTMTPGARKRQKRYHGPQPKQYDGDGDDDKNDGDNDDHDSSQNAQRSNKVLSCVIQGV